jgi:hypothetical protein
MLLSSSGSRVALCTRVTLSLALVSWGTASLLAQEQERTELREGPSFALNGVRSQQCVRFLMEPAVAAKQRREGYRPIRADQDQSLHPALRHVVAAQPEFAAWTPASLCFFYSDTVSVGRRRVTEKNPRRAPMIGIWTLAAEDQGRRSRRDLVLDFSAGDSRVVRGAEAVKLRLREAASVVSKARESSDELHDVRIGKTRLVWTGRTAGDSSRVEEPIVESWLMKGASGTAWKIRMTFEPVWSRPLVGVLSVEGKDDLAKALKGSPIRFVGPRYLGGSATLRFAR